MPKEILTPDDNSSLTADQIAAAVQAESLRAARTGLTNALGNAGMPNYYAPNTAPSPIASGSYLNPTTQPTPEPSGQNPNIPPLNDRTKVPTEPAGDGFQWQWISMAKANNPYGGEWRKVAVTKSGGSGAGAGGSGSTGSTGGGQKFTTADGKTFDNYSDYLSWQSKLDMDKSARQSAYDLLYSQFKQYGLESLVEGIKGLIQSNVSPSEFAIQLQNTDAYKQRFAANQDRIKQGLRALTPAEYIGLEDQYQNIMRNYGLPASYYTKDAMGTQAGFNKFIANDVSAAELEDRIATAQKRVLNADVNVKDALKAFYPDITNADILAYTLDPTNALENIKRKVTAAEIQGAATAQGFNKIDTSTTEAQVKALEARAQELAGYGVTKAQAQQGYASIGEFLPTATTLSDIYNKQGLGPYNQQTAEAEVFNTADAAAAARKRKKLSALEQAQFGGQAGTAQGALGRERQGSF